MTNHDRHYSVWRVEVRQKKSKWPPDTLQGRTRFKVTAPTDPCSDYVDVRMFDTFADAMNFAQREAFKEKLKLDFDDYLDTVQNPWCAKEDQHTGLGTMHRVFQWWGRYDLAEFLENV